MATVKSKKEVISAEQKIITAARKLFTQKGFDAVKTRDIAKEAGINIALLNYYFRSKEKLFEIIMQENMQEFFMSINQLINDEKTEVKHKIDLLVNKYIDILSANPQLPLFVMSNMRNNPQRGELQNKFRESYFMKQVQEEIKSGKIAPIKPVNFMMNIVGLTIFPFIGRTMIQNINGVDDKQFNELMEERRKMIPKWIEAMLKVK
jgi:AcrR family transcriptional regulator